MLSYPQLSKLCYHLLLARLAITARSLLSFARTDRSRGRKEEERKVLSSFKGKEREKRRRKTRKCSMYLRRLFPKSIIGPRFKPNCYKYTRMSTIVLVFLIHLILFIKQNLGFQFSWIGSRTRELQKAKVGSNERKCCRDGLATKSGQLSATYLVGGIC